MSEILVHTAVSDDVVRLALACHDLSPLTRLGLTASPEMLTLGACTRGADRHSVRLLGKIRMDAAGDPELKCNPGRIDHLAFVLGWLTHRAADRQMKPVFRANPDPEGRSPTECSVYQDAFVLREILVPLERQPFAQASGESNEDSMWLSLLKESCDPNHDADPVVRLERLITVMLQRALLSFHTLIPDDTGIESWIDKVAGLVQSRENDPGRYADAILNPDPELVQRYVVDTNFYDVSDPIIAAARGLPTNGSPGAGGRAGAVPGTMTVAEALLLGGGSHYAQAVRTGLGYVLATDSYLANAIDESILADRLDIGKAGRDGAPV